MELLTADPQHPRGSGLVALTPGQRVPDSGAPLLVSSQPGEQVRQTPERDNLFCHCTQLTNVAGPGVGHESIKILGG